MSNIGKFKIKLINSTIYKFVIKFNCSKSFNSSQWREPIIKVIVQLSYCTTIPVTFIVRPPNIFIPHCTRPVRRLVLFLVRSRTRSRTKGATPRSAHFLRTPLSCHETYSRHIFQRIIFVTLSFCCVV